MIRLLILICLFLSQFALSQERTSDTITRPRLNNYLMIDAHATYNFKKYRYRAFSRRYDLFNDAIAKKVNYFLSASYEMQLNKKWKTALSVGYWKESYSLDPVSIKMGYIYDIIRYRDKSISVSSRMDYEWKNKKHVSYNLYVELHELIQIEETYVGPLPSDPDSTERKTEHYGNRISLGLYMNFRTGSDLPFRILARLSSPHFFFHPENERRVTGWNVALGIGIGIRTRSRPTG